MLGDIKLLVVVELVLLGTVAVPLLDALLVADGPHEHLVPLNKGEPAVESGIEIEERVTSGPVEAFCTG